MGVYLYVSAPPEPTDPQYVCVSHMKIRWGRHRQNTHLPNGSAGCIEIRPRPFSIQDNRSRTHKHAQREALNERCERQRKQREALNERHEREMQLAVVQIKAAQAAQTAHMWTVCKVMDMTFLPARSVRRIETRGTENRRGRVTGIQPATKKGSKNLLTHTHTHNTLTYTDSNTALCNEEKLANPLCVIVEVLNKAICNEEMLANPLCDCWSFE